MKKNDGGREGGIEMMTRMVGDEEDGGRNIRREGRREGERERERGMREREGSGLWMWRPRGEKSEEMQ
jgi:hypothetical protein